MTGPAKPKKNNSNDVLKYSGMAFQMAFALALGWWIGRWIDRYLHTVKPYFSLAFSILFLAAYFVKLIRDISRK
ncbi:MAG: AtpZ/AtpI family protein [Saprospiraceae bacterium]|nr:AtpZ/AtpI family protein [Saprospiraceae bacterium]